MIQFTQDKITTIRATETTIIMMAELTKYLKDKHKLTKAPSYDKVIQEMIKNYFEIEHFQN